MQRLIVAALETAMRPSELMGLQYRAVDFARGDIVIETWTNKTRRERRIPITARLSAILEMARTETQGALDRRWPNDRPQERAQRLAEAFVFGDPDGRQIRHARKAWNTTVLKAHGYTPTWASKNALGRDSLAALREINLQFGDLRHEAAWRFYVAWKHNLAAVSELLGHADLKTTAIYLNVTPANLKDAMRTLDTARASAGVTFAEATPAAAPGSRRLSVTVVSPTGKNGGRKGNANKGQVTVN
jgi:integrase